MKSIRKDSLREIKMSLGRFISIFAIVALGVAFYAGIQASVPDMLHTADKYYDDYNLMDLRVTSYFGLTEEDVDKIREIEGIDGVYPTHLKDVITAAESSKIVLRVHGIPVGNLKHEDKNYINQINITEGRLPERSGECLVEKGNFIDNDLKIGDKITLESGREEPLSESMNNTEYTIVGIATIPYYISLTKGTTSIGHGTVDSFILVPEADFKTDVYTDVFITVKGAKEVNSYDDEYFDIIDKVTDKLEALGEERNAPVPGAKWYVLDRNTHFGFLEYKNAADSMDSIAKIFPVFFFFVAVLVCVTTMTRMVDEQRGSIGTYKALGYSESNIISKYIIYSASAGIGGGILGSIIGMLVFPWVIFNAWGIVYTLPPISYVFQPILAVCAILAAVIVTTAATFFTCKREMSETPSILMRPKAPKTGKKIFMERITFVWKRMTFIQKVTARNIFRYKKRFIFTIIGISGCAALLLAGYGVKDSVSDIVNLHFHEIHTYHGELSYSSNLSSEEREGLKGVFEKYDGVSETLSVCQYYMSFSTENRDLTVTVLIPEDSKRLKDFINLRDSHSKKGIELSDKGVLIDEKLSKELKVSIGDKISVAGRDGVKKELEITGIIENYVAHYIIMSPNMYRTTYNSEADKTALFLKLEDISQEKEKVLGEKLMNDARISGVSFNTGIEESFNDMIKSMDLITVVLIISAGILAFIVLYNLTNVAVSERLREIATIKVLGFYDREVSSYVYRENIILTVIGSLAGLGLGVLLHGVIMNVIDMKNIMFGTSIKLTSFVLSIIITMLFSIIVNLVMYRKLKKIPMVESLKSVE